MGRLLHLAVYIAPPLWCQLGTLFLDSPPLDEHVARQALRLSIAGYQIADPLHFETHLIFVPGGSPQYGFFDSIGHGISFVLPQHHPLVL